MKYNYIQNDAMQSITNSLGTNYKHLHYYYYTIGFGGSIEGLWRCTPKVFSLIVFSLAPNKWLTRWKSFQMYSRKIVSCLQCSIREWVGRIPNKSISVDVLLPTVKTSRSKGVPLETPQLFNLSHKEFANISKTGFNESHPSEWKLRTHFATDSSLATECTCLF